MAHFYLYFLCTAVVGTLRSVGSNRMTVSIRDVLLQEHPIETGLTIIRHFNLPTEMKCCNRLLVGQQYLFTGSSFTIGRNSMLFSMGCSDIYDVTLRNGQYFYKVSSSNVQKFQPFCPNRF